MAQAAQAVGYGEAVRPAGFTKPGLVARLMGRLAASAELAAQRRQLTGYVGLQDAGRQTGIRG